MLIYEGCLLNKPDKCSGTSESQMKRYTDYLHHHTAYLSLLAPLCLYVVKSSTILCFVCLSFYLLYRFESFRDGRSYMSFELCPLKQRSLEKKVRKTKTKGCAARYRSLFRHKTITSNRQDTNLILVFKTSHTELNITSSPTPYELV